MGKTATILAKEGAPDGCPLEKGPPLCAGEPGGEALQVAAPEAAPALGLVGASKFGIGLGAHEGNAQFHRWVEAEGPKEGAGLVEDIQRGLGGSKLDEDLGEEALDQDQRVGESILFGLPGQGFGLGESDPFAAKPRFELDDLEFSLKLSVA